MQRWWKLQQRSLCPLSLWLRMSLQLLLCWKGRRYWYIKSRISRSISFPLSSDRESNIEWNYLLGRAGRCTAHLPICTSLKSFFYLLGHCLSMLPLLFFTFLRRLFRVRMAIMESWALNCKATISFSPSAAPCRSVRMLLGVAATLQTAGGQHFPWGPGGVCVMCAQSELDLTQKKTQNKTCRNCESQNSKCMTCLQDSSQRLKIKLQYTISYLIT